MKDRIAECGNALAELESNVGYYEKKVERVYENQRRVVTWITPTERQAFTDEMVYLFVFL